MKIAIIGRANVGKSTLFNRLSNGPRALVSSISGTTRDRKENEVFWIGKHFTLIDTGGLDINPHDVIEKKIAEQAEKALSLATVILFVVDTKVGITRADQEIAKLLRTLKKTVFLVANKTDAPKDVTLVSEFYKLGFGTPWPVSAVSGTGTGDLLDAVISVGGTEKIIKPSHFTVAIIGKPNVGKSSLINALSGEDRAIVHDEPYTTRDTTQIFLTFHSSRVTILDTAGIRRKNKIRAGDIESESVELALTGLHKSEVVILMTDASLPLTAQDRTLAEAIKNSQASVIIVGNKWDLIEEKDEKKSDVFENYYRKQLNFLTFAPIILLSAKNKTKLTRLKETIQLVYEERFRKIDDNALSKFLKTVIKRQKPTIGKGTRKPYIHKLQQVGVNPPQFEVHIAAETSLKYTYLNYIERQLREKFGFVGSPLKLWVVKKESKRP